ncbi:senecionine N-oxygenase-like [Armigeres subalbatus]|uniref:senecionine N-oxygenase-like n=1 Tax=Armigeres subalbatus TaxID=124917 RepID=UPI002ED33B5C
MDSGQRYCVIGAGTAGLAAAKRILETGAEVIVFEQTDQLGGTWNYTDSVGKDKYGLDIHTSMYQGLRTNLPKEVMGFPDFPIPEQEESYIPSQDILSFLKSYADKFEVTRHVRLEHHVVLVDIVEGPKKWKILVKNLPEQRMETFFFDFVFVCNGHYHTPRLPYVRNCDLFEGKQLHSHDYRTSDHFKDERVLVVGAGPSGMDLALEISKKAFHVTLSHHTKESFKTVFPSNLIQKPDVSELTSVGAVFQDGTSESFTVILYCTGYRYSFPFLSANCGVVVEDNYVHPLYKHCININQPTMTFIGLPYYVCAAQMFDLQARFCLAYYTGKKELPTKDDMLADMHEQMKQKWMQGLRKNQSHMMGPAQGDYYDDLAKTAEVEPIKPVMTRLHNESSQRFNDNLLHFRKDVFRIVDDNTYEEVVGNL